MAKVYAITAVSAGKPFEGGPNGRKSTWVPYFLTLQGLSRKVQLNLSPTEAPPEPSDRLTGAVQRRPEHQTDKFKRDRSKPSSNGAAPEPSQGFTQLADRLRSEHYRAALMAAVEMCKADKIKPEQVLPSADRFFEAIEAKVNGA